jgi:hypothetical protein
VVCAAVGPAVASRPMAAYSANLGGNVCSFKTMSIEVGKPGYFPGGRSGAIARAQGPNSQVRQDVFSMARRGSSNKRMAPGYEVWCPRPEPVIRNRLAAAGRIRAFKTPPVRHSFGQKLDQVNYLAEFASGRFQ